MVAEQSGQIRVILAYPIIQREKVEKFDDDSTKKNRQ